MRQQLADELNAEDLLEQRKELALGAVHQLNELFKPLNAAVKSVHPRAQIAWLEDAVDLVEGGGVVLHVLENIHRYNQIEARIAEGHSHCVGSVDVDLE